MNNAVHFYIDAYKKGECNSNILFRTLLLHAWNVQKYSDTELYLNLATPDTPNSIQGIDIVKHLFSDIVSLFIEYGTPFQLEITENNIPLLYDYTAIIHFEQFLYKKHPHFTDLDLTYIHQYNHFYFVFDADDNYTQTQWLLTPSKEFFFMPAVFTSEDLAEEFLHYPYLPPPETGKERYTLQTNGTRLFAMLRQMPIDQIAINPYTSQKTLYFPPSFISKVL
jgi:hypothetical protein